MKFYVPIFLPMLLVACHPAAVEKQLSAEATVLGVGGDCHAPLLNFSSGQKDIEQLVGANSYGLYYAISLDKSLQAAGTKLTVTVRKPGAGEFLVCTAMGPAYQAVTIVNASVK